MKLNLGKKVNFGSLDKLEKLIRCGKSLKIKIAKNKNF
jgi:hypothetical protein